MMLMSVVLTCLLGLTAASPIVQKDVLDDLVTQRSLNSVSNPEGQQTNMPVYTPALLPVTPAVPASQIIPGVPVAPAVPADGQRIITDQLVPGVPGVLVGPVGRPDGQQVAVDQAAVHSSSESESSEQSESVETLTPLPPDSSSERSDSASDPDTSEQTAESLNVTSDDTTSEETPSPLHAQLAHQTGLDGDLGDNSQASEESVRRSWLHAFRRNFHQQIYGGIVLQGVATSPPATGVATGTAALGVTVGNRPTVAPTLSAPALTTPATEKDSEASESIESKEEAELQEWRECRETTDNGDCISHRAVNDDGNIENDLHHGPLRLEEDHAHMTI
ncbi:uncharacterized protein LOC108413401 [Pygocentrus nattereri]|uniref:uncharacterized protein LOC108413401 n=1 Tax=Pygocentrus nattereri TaxID=42514 RepID=UPI0018916F73|nr:uncharacterized protein LOC108413401 [Pygocentrus nattereri]